MLATSGRSRFSAALALVGLSLLAFGTTACTGGGTSTSGHSPGRELSALRLKSYSSLGELRKDADLVAVVTVRSQKETAATGSAPGSTDSEVTLDRVLSGRKPTANPVVVHQLGTSEVALSDTPGLLKTGATYLLFLSAFHLAPNDDTGLYTITGSAGDYLQRPGGRDYQLQDPESPALPQTITEDQAAAS